MAKLSDEEYLNKLKCEWGYEGKPKQWQQGFDAGLKEIAELLRRLDKGRKAIEVCRSMLNIEDLWCPLPESYNPEHEGEVQVLYKARNLMNEAIADYEKEKP